MIELRGERVVLRPIRADEVEDVFTKNARVEGTVSAVRMADRERLLKRFARSGRWNRGILDLAIETDGRLVGDVQARRRPGQALPPGVYELGIVIYEDGDRGRGLGTEAVRLLTDWLFERERAGRVQVSTEVGNAAMRRALERLGFAFEGVLRAFMPAGEGRSDYAMYSLVGEERPAPAR